MSGSKDRNDLICVGAITGVHGVRGVLTIRPFTEHAQDIAAYGPVQTRDGKKTFSLNIIGSKKGVLMVRLDGISDRTAAETLKGTELFVTRDKLPETEEGSWYQSDLIGLEVRDMDAVPLGRIKAVQNFGAGDLLEIHLSNEDRDILLSFTREVVPIINLAEGYVSIDPPEDAPDD